jgi:hypothetical protein
VCRSAKSLNIERTKDTMSNNKIATNGAKMKAVICTKYGLPEVVRIEERPRETMI